MIGGEFKRGAGVEKTTFDDARFKTATRVEGGQVVMEAFIPSSALGAAPKAGASWRAALGLRRVGRSDAPAGAIWPVAKPAGILEGGNWGVLRFRD